jgi:hypothetical protein
MKKIFVSNQLRPKYIDGDLRVSTNRYIESFKLIRDLKCGDEFCFDGAWYTFESSIDI